MRKLTASFFGSLIAALALAFAPGASAQTGSGDSGGECSGGLCGTPDQTGGGGCGCGGGSILVNNTDIGDTYQYADDYDNDGFEDDFDNCPFAANFDQIDSDGDDVGDVCDNCIAASNLNQLDTDSDGIGDSCDDDIDNDGVLNAVDVCDLVADPGQVDTNLDGIGNACQDDDDGDGVLDADDNCPLVANPLVNGVQAIPDDASLCDTDSDGDGVPDRVDNCVAERNFDQANMDDDLAGDACDGDIDDDGLANLRDNCPRIANALQSDVDRDRIGDACDDRLCYVIHAGGVTDEATTDLNHCLDPETTFTVLSLPTDEGKVGIPSHLHLFANRENTAMRYVWTVTSRPSGSEARVSNPRGSVAVSTPWEYLYLNGKRAEFTPDVPGEYTLQVSAELVFPDTKFPSASTSVATFTLRAEEGEESSGCTSIRGDLSLVGLALFGLVGLAVRRRRR